MNDSRPIQIATPAAVLVPLERIEEMDDADLGAAVRAIGATYDAVVSQA